MVRPVGARTEIPVDVRLVTATNMDIEEAVVARRFREDLYFRINVIQMNLPPLRARGSDVLALAEKFLHHFATLADKRVTSLSTAAAAKLLAYPWPGNVRELQNCIERAVALTAHEQLSAEDLPARIRDYQSVHILVAGDDPSELATLDEMERRYVLKVLEAVGGKRTLAARVLGLNRKTLYRKLGRYDPAHKK
jgi:DNA-binding NtrC family response regulator